MQDSVSLCSEPNSVARYGTFDGNAFDDDTFDTDIFEPVNPPGSNWTAKPNPSSIWTPKTMPTTPWAPNDDDGF